MSILLPCMVVHHLYAYLVPTEARNSNSLGLELQTVVSHHAAAKNSPSGPLEEHHIHTCS